VFNDKLVKRKKEQGGPKIVNCYWFLDTSY